MTNIRSRFVIVLSGVVASTALVAGRQAAPGAPTRVTAAANVTLRAMPLPGGDIVGQLPLGTEVTESGPPGLDQTWVRVKLTDGREGWVTTNLTRTLDPNKRTKAFDAIIADRVGRKGDSFRAQAELVAFVERVLPEFDDPGGKARIGLARLRAMASAAAAIPSHAATREPYASWVKAHAADLEFDEAGNRWIVLDKSIWALDTRSAATGWADEIGWFAVTNGLGGECAGFLSCYIDERNHFEGEYLRRHPKGQHIDEAVDAISKTATLLTEPNARFDFNAGRDCRDLVAASEALMTAVATTEASGRDAALTNLAVVRGKCGVPR